MDTDRTITRTFSRGTFIVPALQHSYDLVLLAGLALLLPVLVLLPIPVLRIPLGLIAVLLAPGYAFLSALFPGKDDFDGSARIGLSFGLSVPIVPVLALPLHWLPWGIRLWPITIALTVWILLWCALAAQRRRTLMTRDQAYTPPVIDWADRWRRLSGHRRARYVMGVMAVIGALVLGGWLFSLLTDDPSRRLTEFYILGPEGLAENYPRAAAPGQALQVEAGIINRESQTARYRIEVRSAGQLLIHVGPIILEPGMRWSAPLRFVLTRPGANQQVEILLFQNDERTPDRYLQLRINVQSSP